MPGPKAIADELLVADPDDVRRRREPWRHEDELESAWHPVSRGD